MTDPAPTRRGTRLAHIGVAVSSLEAILPFYRDLLGMPEVPLDDADGARIAGLQAGDALVELLEPKVADWYADNVIGGPGAFTVVADGNHRFAEAFLRKLTVEVAALVP